MTSGQLSRGARCGAAEECLLPGRLCCKTLCCVARAQQAQKIWRSFQGCIGHRGQCAAKWFKPLLDPRVDQQTRRFWQRTPIADLPFVGVLTHSPILLPAVLVGEMRPPQGGTGRRTCPRRAPQRKPKDPQCGLVGVLNELADAIVVEPVSTPKFPASREKNREFSNWASFAD